MAVRDCEEKGKDKEEDKEFEESAEGFFQPSEAKRGALMGCDIS